MTKRLAIAAGALLALSGCAMVTRAPLTGSIYMDVKAPLTATSNANATKVGTAQATSILGLFATGDASIDAAAKSAGISKIRHVDEHSKSVLGIFAQYEVFVYGE